MVPSLRSSPSLSSLASSLSFSSSSNNSQKKTPTTSRLSKLLSRFKSTSPYSNNDRNALNTPSASKDSLAQSDAVEGLERRSIDDMQTPMQARDDGRRMARDELEKDLMEVWGIRAIGSPPKMPDFDWDEDDDPVSGSGSGSGSSGDAGKKDDDKRRSTYSSLTSASNGSSLLKKTMALQKDEDETDLTIPSTSLATTSNRMSSVSMPAINSGKAKDESKDENVPVEALKRATSPVPTNSRQPLTALRSLQNLPLASTGSSTSSLGSNVPPLKRPMFLSSRRLTSSTIERQSKESSSPEYQSDSISSSHSQTVDETPNQEREIRKIKRGPRRVKVVDTETEDPEPEAEPEADASREEQGRRSSRELREMFRRKDVMVESSPEEERDVSTARPQRRSTSPLSNGDSPSLGATPRPRFSNERIPLQSSLSSVEERPKSRLEHLSNQRIIDRPVSIVNMARTIERDERPLSRMSKEGSKSSNERDRPLSRVERERERDRAVMESIDRPISRLERREWRESVERPSSRVERMDWEQESELERRSPEFEMMRAKKDSPTEKNMLTMRGPEDRGMNLENTGLRYVGEREREEREYQPRREMPPPSLPHTRQGYDQPQYYDQQYIRSTSRPTDYPSMHPPSSTSRPLPLEYNSSRPISEYPTPQHYGHPGRTQSSGPPLSVSSQYHHDPYNSQYRQPPPPSHYQQPPYGNPPTQQPGPPTQSTAKKLSPTIINGRPYYRIGLIGKGGSSRVFRVLDNVGGMNSRMYALKRVDLAKNDTESYESFVNEIKLLNKLKGNARVITLIDSQIDRVKNQLFLLMEVGETDLNGLLMEQLGKPISLNFVRYIWEQMLQCVQVVHDANIVHSDLKPANFVLVKGNLKLIDFGISKAIPNDTTNIGREQQIGTANYMSPEALCDSGKGSDGKRLMKLGRPSDVWSLGCILYQMVYGRTPFSHIKNISQKMVAIQNENHVIEFKKESVPLNEKGEPNPSLKVVLEQDLIDTMKSCFAFVPKQRATIPELLEAPFLRGRSAPGQSLKKEEDLDFSQCSPDVISHIVSRVVRWTNQKPAPTMLEQDRMVERLLRDIALSRS